MTSTFTNTIINIPANWQDHIGLIRRKNGAGIFEARNYCSEKGKGIKITIEGTAGSGKQYISVSTFKNDSTAQGKIARAQHFFRTLFLKIPGQPERNDKKPVQDQKKSIGRFDLLRGQESKDRNFLESESDESDTEDEEESFPEPEVKALPMAFSAKFKGRRSGRSGKVERTSSPDIEKFVN